jgi:ADP-heptose:LPS heptosyltransferase
MGDAVLTFPMIEALARFYAGAPLDILGERRNAEVYKINPHVKNIYCYDKDAAAMFRNLFSAHYDLIVDTEQFYYLSTLLGRILRPTYLCGFASRIRTPLLTHTVTYSERDYEAVSFLNLARTLTGQEFPFDGETPFLEIPDPLKSWADETIYRLRYSSYVTLMPGATSRERMWPVKRYAETIQWLANRGLSVVILGGKDTKSAANQLTQNYESRDVLDLSGRTSLPQTAALIRKACAHLSSDTGVLHIAAGLGTPTVSLFGPGLHEKWGPTGKQHRVIRTGLPCSPCTRKSDIPPCPRKAACMEKIPVENVKKALVEVLEENVMIVAQKPTPKEVRG